MNLENYQVTKEESISLIKRNKKKVKKIKILIEEIGQYFPLPKEDPSMKNKMSLMLVYDTTKRPKPDKSPNYEIKDKKPIRDEIHSKEEKKKKKAEIMKDLLELTEDMKLIHPIKKEYRTFQNEMDRPPWMDDR